MSSVHRAADRLVRNLSESPAGEFTRTRTTTAVVAAVNPTGARDGGPLVTVNWRGTEAVATFKASYTPIVGHVVECTYNGAQLSITGRNIGTPPES